MSQGIREDEEFRETEKENTEGALEKERQRAVELFQERVKSGRALNIALIGASGCGKSSFCNSVMTAFCVEGWRERATIGHYGGLAEQVTHHLMSFPKIEYLDFDALYDYNYPTLVDMNGFNDSSDDLVEELLRIVFFGRLPQEERLMDAVKLHRSKGIDGLREHYSKNYELLKIDRIIFIASATSPLPHRLMEAVRKTARKEDRVIPIFGVLTHKDKINENDEDFRTLEKDFREGLGLPDNRFLLCTTYCDDYDKHHGKSRLDQRHPELDIPILKFMRQVCDPVFKVIKDQIKYKNEKEEPDPDSSTQAEPERPAPARLGAAQGGIPATTRMMIRGAVVAVLVYFLLPFLTNGLDVSRVCAELCPGTQCTRSLQSLCAGQSSLWKVVVTLLFAGAIIGLDLMLDKLEQSGRN
uniref:Uncharacterized protein LOC111104535 n=1 Tax=Crassostrea virginica TaxID=6565 RepID=A0A8B8ASU2_CRAVI|nr:uncharacterized protein LOC111104535 [Crassostrea virginica]